MLVALWWVLSEGAGSGWSFGVLAVILALGAVQSMPRADNGPDVSSPALRWRALPAFLFFFLTRSIAAGLDVARRTLTPSLSLAPAILQLPTTLPPGRAQVFLATTLSLLPGSLAVSLEDSIVTMHVLDERADVAGDLRVAERYVGPLFHAAAP
jgi:multicomponent Na+:H+ antiporter subunit E